MKQLTKILPKKSGRSGGTISVRHHGGRQKRFLRVIDFKRDKREISAVVESIEYEPNRNANVALLLYKDGERRYILAPDGLALRQKVVSAADAPLEVGNAKPLSSIPIGIQVHNLEIKPGKGGQIVKSAGSYAVVQSKEKGYVLVKLPSGEVKRFKSESWATIGQVGNLEQKTIRLGKAGRKRRMGIRPTVRGTAQHVGQHPHGSGEGRSGVGMKYPKTPYGKPAVGKTRKKVKYSDKLIIKGRKKGPHVG